MRDCFATLAMTVLFYSHCEEQSDVAICFLMMYSDQLKNALIAYFDAIDAQKNSELKEKPPLHPHFEALDRLAAQLPIDTDPQLRHYMKQKSYEKALNFLRELGEGCP